MVSAHGPKIVAILLFRRYFEEMGRKISATGVWRTHYGKDNSHIIKMT